ncbi:MAG: tetratricopeptide repeat protein [Bacteroidota bacterium]|nr:tetratricopeptide repeat protein [Bacteroidota bacterium]
MELKKPKKYEDRTLASEKSDQKKFGFGKRLYQDMVTHYNYYFNANNHLNEIVAAAKAIHRDDYSKLLSFYNYDLTTTAGSKSEIDSVIYHCTAGVLLHDLRNDWIDDLYFLLGKAYYYRKNFDSALNAFQFINYAWAPKDDGYDIPIGSNASGNNGVFSVASKEKTGLLHKTIIEPPVRNANFLWMAKTNIETGSDSRAAGLLQILQHDPNFPKRLQSGLHETLAYLYYNQKKWDSAAIQLSAALGNATNRLESARWEYLIAQMYALSGNKKEASAYFERSANHTPDPIMEVNAYLSSITINNDSTGNTTQEKLSSLLKMAKRDKYIQYRDVIYYAAAQVQMQLNDTTAAKQMLRKSIKSSMGNEEQKSLSFMMLADISYEGKKWVEAHRFYDSTSVAYIADSTQLVRLTTRQPVLDKIALNLINVDKQDSLQKVAAMPEAQRMAYLKKAMRQIRRAQGLAEETPSYGSNNLNPSQDLQAQAQLFQNPSTSTEWYFNNSSLKSSGLGEFRQRWGNRPNVDNWRRQGAIDAAIVSQQQAGNDVDAVATPANGIRASNSTQPAPPPVPQSVEDLEAGLPLTPAKLVASNNTIAENYFKSGVLFQEGLQNYPAAIEMYLNMKRADDSSQYREPSLLNLYYCYTKLNNRQGADSALSLLKEKYPNGKSLISMTSSHKKISERSEKNPATKAYDSIYNSFIEGNFKEAKKQKAAADSLYGNSYWTPQLLYIESIYYVSEHNDSAALRELQNIEIQFTKSPLAVKAATMIDVLRRRREIENYLTKLQVTRNEDSSGSPIINLNSTEVTANKPVRVHTDSIVSQPPPVAKAPVIKTDTTSAKPTVAKAFKYNPADPQFIALLLDKVAPVFASEAKNAFNRYDKQTFYNMPQLNANNVKLDDRYNLVLIGPFTDAVAAFDYIDKVKPITAGKILPWLTPDKFGFTMISQANLDLLNENKDVEGYKKLIQKAVPGKF